MKQRGIISKMDKYWFNQSRLILFGFLDPKNLLKEYNIMVVGAIL